MHYSQIPQKPLVAGVQDKPLSVNQVYFFERSDGQIIITEEQEAWGLYARKPQVLGAGIKHSYKLIGTGDGNIFREALLKAKEVGRTNIPEAQKIIKQGQEDELNACRGRIIAPRNMDKMGNGY